jgi:hypothetical protein
VDRVGPDEDRTKILFIFSLRNKSLCLACQMAGVPSSFTRPWCILLNLFLAMLKNSTTSFFVKEKNARCVFTTCELVGEVMLKNIKFSAGC